MFGNKTLIELAVRNTGSISIDFQKVLKVYQSCKTWEHFEGAMRFAGLFEYKWIDDEAFMEFMMHIYSVHNTTVDRLQNEYIDKSKLN